MPKQKVVRDRRLSCAESSSSSSSALSGDRHEDIGRFQGTWTGSGRAVVTALTGAPISSAATAGELAARAVLVLAFLISRRMDAVFYDFDHTDWRPYSYKVAERTKVPIPLLYAILLAVPPMSLLLVVTVAGGVKRFLRFYRTDAAAFLMAVSLALAADLAVVNVVKVLVGGLRPDYLHRCYPSLFQTHDSTLISRFPYHATSCENVTKRVLDGRKSFPSGHASYSAAVAAVAGIFLFRTLRSMPREAMRSKTAAAVSVRGMAFLIALTVGFILPVWIGATRITDRRHHFSDVLAGLLIGWAIGIASFWTYCGYRDPSSTNDAGITIETGKDGHTEQNRTAD